MADITYCGNHRCPFKKCERHLEHAPKSGAVSVANLDGVCRRYICWLVDEAVDRWVALDGGEKRSEQEMKIKYSTTEGVVKRSDFYIDWRAYRKIYEVPHPLIGWVFKARIRGRGHDLMIAKDGFEDLDQLDAWLDDVVAAVERHISEKGENNHEDT